MSEICLRRSKKVTGPPVAGNGTATDGKSNRQKREIWERRYRDCGSRGDVDEERENRRASDGVKRIELDTPGAVTGSRIFH